MIEDTNCNIEQMAVHRIGNKVNDEALILSETDLDLNDTELRELLIRYFLRPFQSPEMFGFTSSNGDFRLNPLYQYVSNIFSDPASFHQNSIYIAKHLYEKTSHPNIKTGDLFVVRMDHLRIGDMQSPAIGLFKSENIQPFLKLHQSAHDFSIEYDAGINIEKLDKGCIVFNLNKESGYRILLPDPSNRLSEAQYWQDVFLNIRPLNDDYHMTKEFMNITKRYITNQLSQEFVIEKADQIDLLNRSIHYFKNHTSFNGEEFEKDVFSDKDVIHSFRQYKSNLNGANDIEVDEAFTISPSAVQKQKRVFKSILKLDKNFHIYIHGDRNMIERGTDNDGRKYYKIYFEHED